MRGFLSLAFNAGSRFGFPSLPFPFPVTSLPPTFPLLSPPAVASSPTSAQGTLAGTAALLRGAVIGAGGETSAPSGRPISLPAVPFVYITQRTAPLTIPPPPPLLPRASRLTRPTLPAPLPPLPGRPLPGASAQWPFDEVRPLWTALAGASSDGKSTLRSGRAGGSAKDTDPRHLRLLHALTAWLEECDTHGASPGCCCTDGTAGITLEHVCPTCVNLFRLIHVLRLFPSILCPGGGLRMSVWQTLSRSSLSRWLAFTGPVPALTAVTVSAVPSAQAPRLPSLQTRGRSPLHC